MGPWVGIITTHTIWGVVWEGALAILARVYTSAGKIWYGPGRELLIDKKMRGCLVDGAIIGFGSCV